MLRSCARSKRRASTSLALLVSTGFTPLSLIAGKDADALERRDELEGRPKLPGALERLLLCDGAAFPRARRRSQGGQRGHAATETLHGDVQSVIGNIMQAKYGDGWRVPSWQTIETAPDREVLLYFPPILAETYRQGKHPAMRRMGRFTDFPYQRPTHWMDPGEPEPFSNRVASMP